MNSLRVLSLGGGVQSTTIALMAIEGELPALDAVIFADTGAEPNAVYEHIAWLRGVLEKAGVPLYIVRNGNLAEDLKRKRRFASIPAYVRNTRGETGMLRRQCTHEYKIKPIRRLLRELGATRENPATVALGISLEEAGRMRDSRVSYIRHSYPLVEKRMRRSDCILWLRRRGYPIPPKSSCVFCPFHTNTYWRMLQREHAEDFEKACVADEQIRQLPNVQGECYIHRSLRPLRSLHFEEQAELPLLEECTGHCHT